MDKQRELTYDEAYGRLQAIAAEVNGGALGVDRIEALLDEADAMVVRCREQLYGLEKRVARSVELWKSVPDRREEGRDE